MTLNDELFAALGDSGLQQIAGLLGTDTAQARTAVEAAVGTIVGGMAHRTGDAQGAQALRSALDQHVDKDPFTAVTADPQGLEREGHGILGHVLGQQGTEQAAAGISQFAGLNSQQVMKLLAALASIVMSLLANRANRQGMDAGAVADDLDREQSSARSGGLGDVLGGLLGSILGGQGAGGGGLGDVLGGMLGGGGQAPRPGQEAPGGGQEPRPRPEAPGGGQESRPRPEEAPPAPEDTPRGGTNPDW
ncbi:DUF937 domain-containing protein [Nonomuraea dietziae]|uniref:DUF937 domain-containing protein n=1 Tax=Nonomuraea dietziae TaxID=65515 RepID=UPI0033D901D4